jgi:hypothetical protein
MPGYHTPQPQLSIWQRLWSTVKREAVPITAGAALSLATGSIVGLAGGYGAISGYMSAGDTARSKFSKMIGLGAASSATTFGLGLAVGPLGAGIGAAVTMASASYFNYGIIKAGVSALINIVKKVFRSAKKVDNISHEQSHAQSPQQPAKHQVASPTIRPSLRDRVRAVGARARDIGAKMFGREAHKTIDAALEARRAREMKLTEGPQKH